MHTQKKIITHRCYTVEMIWLVGWLVDPAGTICVCIYIYTFMNDLPNLHVACYGFIYMGHIWF